MKYLQRARNSRRISAARGEPMQGVANLFDVALVFIVALLLTLMSTYQVLDFFNPESEITVMKKTEGQWRIITKKGRQIKAMKVSPEKAQGQGQRLGVAYRLQDGTMVYVPEE